MLKSIALLLLLLSPYANAQNGNDRGGGDPIAAEVFNIARGISKKINLWNENGTIKLSTAQVAAIQNLLIPGNLTVIALDHTFRHPELLPSLEALEVTLVNVAKHTPAMIEVGKIRWKELEGKPLEKEMMVLHELMGAAGLLENGQRIDDQFYLSYELKVKTLSAWEKYKDDLLNSLMKIYYLNMGALHLDLGHLKTFAETVELTSTYKKIIHPELYEKKKKAQKDLQIDSYNELVQMVHESCYNSFIGKNMQTNVNFYKNEANKVIQEYARSIQNADPEWKDWSIKIVNDYIAKYMNVVRTFQKQLDSNFVSNYVTSHCPNPYTGAVDELTVCMLESMKHGLQESQNAVTEGYLQTLVVNLGGELEKISTTITPDEIK